ncbi:MAG: extracellular solute-binding protein [Myxococcota bacterium]|nr:extracellular solute-binding protein [Myxococcota bacterium]
MSGKTRRTSRRDILTAAALGAAALGSGIPISGCKKDGMDKKAKRKTLRIVQWNHFVPAFDKWFNEKYCKEWGDQNDTDVTVDNVGIPALNPAAAVEVSSKKGHDLFGFLWPRPVYEEDVIDHAEIYQECEKRYGKAIDLAVKSTYNPRTKKYFGFSDSFAPDPINWRKDLFDEAGGTPDSWDAIRAFGKKIKDKTGIPVGIGQSSDIDTAMAMRAVLYSFGASEQDADGALVLDSKETLEAVKFIKALYQDAMTPEVLSWDASSNNRAMLAGKASLVLNAISITREAENKGMAIGENIWLAKAAKGRMRRMGLEHVMNVYCIWKFSENIEGAKKFLIDYVGNFREAFLRSEFYNFPCFPKQVPDLAQLVQKDSKGKPADKYAVLTDATDWATNVGYPGYTNAAIDDGYSTWVLNTMFAQAATGALSPEDSVREATKKYATIWAKWRERKLL